MVETPDLAQDHSKMEFGEKIIWGQLNIWRTKFFTDMWFSQGVDRHFVLSFSVKTSWGQWIGFPTKVKKPHFYHIFDVYWMIQIFSDNLASSLSFLYCPLTSNQISERSYDRFSRKTRDGRTNERTDERKNERRQIYRTNLQSRWVQNNHVKTTRLSQGCSILIFTLLICILWSKLWHK